MGVAWSEMQFEVHHVFIHKSKIEEAKRGGKSAIWLILCLSIKVVSTIYSSILHGLRSKRLWSVRLMISPRK